jgi:hypothetical protein
MMEELSEADVPRNFSVLAWVMTIPLCDDLWLSMQAQHIAAVEIAIIRPMELEAARTIFAEEPYAHIMLPLNGVSQMWLFSLYEFMRTWRQRANKILKLANQYQRTKPAKQAEFLKTAIDDAEGKEKHIFSAISFYSKHIAKIGDKAFVTAVQDYWDKIDGFFHWIEGLRMNLAKHEVPKLRGIVAEMPGYARMDLIRGSLYWQYTDAHGGLQKLARREAANFFLDIKIPDIGPDD